MSTLKSNNIQKELAEIAPILATLPKRNNLVIPEHYFDDVENEILSQLKLSDLKRSQLQIPDSYFEDLEDKILHKVNNSPMVNTVTMHRWMRYVAAALVVVIMSIFAFQYIPLSTAPSQVADSIEVNDYLQYLQQNIEDGDIEMLIDSGLVEESDLTVVELPSQDSTLDGEDFFVTELEF